jgi:ABC-2 type transport system permease protein
MLGDFVTVYGAEVARRIRSRPFIIGLLIGVVGVVCFTLLPQLFISMDAASIYRVVLVAEPPLAHRAAGLLRADFTIVATVPEQKPDASLLRRYKVAAAIVVSRAGSSLQVAVYAKDPGNVAEGALRRDLIPLALEQETALPPGRIATLLRLPIGVHPVSSRFESSAASDAAHGIGFMLIFLLYIIILFNSQLVMTSVAEEKTTRIAELLVASVDPIALLAGKICAAATLALLQMLVWIAAAVALHGGLSPSPHGPAVRVADLIGANVMSPGMLVAFLLFFILGFFQLSTLFAALASLINRIEDLGSVTMPLVMPNVLAFIVALLALQAPDVPWIVGLSFIPGISPYIMFARMSVSDVPAWQVGLSLAINAAALVAIVIAAGKIYRVGMLLYGRLPTFAQVWNVIRS